LVSSTGQKTDFLVDTCSAGAGTLAVTIDGPSKVSMDCTEVEEGYKVRYTPLVPGDYFISIKYNGYHIVGSPFKVTCTGMTCKVPITCMHKNTATYHCKRYTYK
jgi:filamin